ncbi:FecR domain-containing protein [Kordia algicida OT-1]|uniref:Possible anti-sigma factor n=1 Tax=Kordia algicida OT-1 TaxID=391587 RepID=A9DIG5_9FLAO|nr:FecR domain-containing protein [Kordia algicida]EDP97896.1 possible anti-sigma factor [Kordia algicida OT-1]
MKREELIQKWLDHALTPQELEAFKQLDDYEELTKMNNALQYFKAPEVDVEAAYNTVKTTAKNTSKPTSWFKPLLRIAAILVIGLGTYMYATLPTLTTFETVAANKKLVELPDTSAVTLNAVSSLSFDEDSWKEKREVTLDGEAYFKVEKGNTFSVLTDDGIVTVLGTQFNVKQRDNLFEVFCYEGAVQVSHNNTTLVLKPGERYLILNGKEFRNEKENLKEPSWIRNESSFKSLPLQEVIQEFERQYNVTVDAKNVDTSMIFTGSFTHTDMDMALQSITLPSQLKYQKKQNSIILKRD